MKARGDVRATPADAPELTLDEAFWERARIVEVTSAPQNIGASSARCGHARILPLGRSGSPDPHGEHSESLCRDAGTIKAQRDVSPIMLQRGGPVAGLPQYPRGGVRCADRPLGFRQEHVVERYRIARSAARRGEAGSQRNRIPRHALIRPAVAGRLLPDGEGEGRQGEGAWREANGYPPGRDSLQTEPSYRLPSGRCSSRR